VNAIRVAETAVRNNLVEDIECAIRTVKARPARAMTTVEVTPPM